MNITSKRYGKILITYTKWRNEERHQGTHASKMNNE